MYDDLVSYYLRWYHPAPVAISPARQAETERLSRLLYLAAEYMAYHYEDYLERFMPLSERSYGSSAFRTSCLSGPERGGRIISSLPPVNSRYAR